MRMYKEMMRKKGSVNMPISDTIAAIIEEMLDGGGGTAELKRNDLATRVGVCSLSDKLCYHLALLAG